MQPISDADIRVRIASDNRGWENPDYEAPEANFARRVYFEPFKRLALNFDVKRATVLLGPRRVGKTVMIKQLMHDAVASGIAPSNILYVSVDTPIYSGISLEKFLSFMPSSNGNAKRVVIFDEIQYLRDWEIHLKDLVDSTTNIKFVASGSAAAALQLKSKESGAGRFSDFMLPPLTFYEFLLFLGEGEKHIRRIDAGPGTRPRYKYEVTNIESLNTRFVDYLNYGGFPEAVVNEEVRRNPEQFIKNDIIDKVLLKDLPSLYGITGIQELNKLFSFLAYNAGNEASLENICQESGLSKPTIKRYIEYLESAFLIIKVSTVDDTCKTMKRERNFKIYLNNPSMRAALFAPVRADDGQRIGQLAECAIFSQWQHSSAFRSLKYARWKNDGEVDIVHLTGDQKPRWLGEIKWSDRIQSHWGEETKGLSSMLKRHKSITSAFFTTKTIEAESTLEGRRLTIYPSAAYCYLVGRNITSRLDVPLPVATPDESTKDEEE
ncbi:MAG: ATP-binding protein [Rhodospirillaceae bacterium]|nr:ATP-binding protein [Rhodospirillaceae bacterium]